MMTYAKGTVRPSVIDAGWPWQVEIEVPWNVLGIHLAEVTDWVRAHAAPPASAKIGGGRPDTVRWCFAERDFAITFQSAFGGAPIEVPPPKSRRS